MERLGTTQSRMSRHMATLKAAGLVVDRRDAQWVRYRRSPKITGDAERLIEAALSLTSQPERITA
jgi:ArsR family transcriptional regulator